VSTHRDRVAVVTGAAQGIGQALCRRLAERGATVVGVDVAPLAATGALVTQAGGEWLDVRADVSSEHDVEALATTVRERFGRCDILVNNAAIDDAIEWDDLDLDRWRRVLAVNLDAPFLTCKALVPLIRAHGWGRIVNLASGSVVRPMPRFVAYRASKMGVIGFTRALAFELGKDGITVNVTSPGITRTPMASASLGAGALEAEASTRAIPRVAEPDDVVGTILFLTSEDAAFVTGQTLMANGGAAFV
jgi:NAD(P)-dependent dehydrogenase (short-subunit alcohol dehydrogenase family)